MRPKFLLLKIGLASSFTKETRGCRGDQAIASVVQLLLSEPCRVLEGMLVPAELEDPGEAYLWGQRASENPQRKSKSIVKCPREFTWE